MKKLHLLLILPLAFFLLGCPVSIDYPLGELGSEKINQKLIGVWELQGYNEGDYVESEIIRIEFKKNSKYKLNASVLLKGENYMVDPIEWDVYQTELNDKTFLIFTPTDGSGYYHYQYELKDDKIYFNDFSLLINGVEGVTSTESFRIEVSESMKMNGFSGETQIMVRK